MHSNENLIWIDLEMTGLNPLTDRIIEMAWEDRTPFDAIFTQFVLKENVWVKTMSRLKMSW